MMSPESINSVCPLCGANIPIGIENCQALFNEIVAWEYSNPAYAGVHLLAMDAYVLQHSKEHSPRSNAYHMMSLCWMLEHGGSSASGGSSPRDRQQFEAAYREFPFLAPPADRGQITVADVYQASDAVSQSTLIITKYFCKFVLYGDIRGYHFPLDFHLAIRNQFYTRQRLMHGS